MSSDWYNDNPAAKFDELFERRSNLPAPDEGADREATYARLDAVGVDAVLELIASGRLPNEIAIGLKVPVIYFLDWLKDNVPADRLRKAKQACAESFAIKSLLPLTVTYDSPGHASIARALSDRLAWVAERLDPENWGPPKPGESPPAPVTFIFEGMGGKRDRVEMKPAKVVESKPAKDRELKQLLRIEEKAP